MHGNATEPMVTFENAQREESRLAHRGRGLRSAGRGTAEHARNGAEFAAERPAEQGLGQARNLPRVSLRSSVICTQKFSYGHFYSESLLLGI